MTISVTQLNNYIKGLFDIDGVLNDVSVCGEITNVKRAANGWYFSLKDGDSAINCFCYFSAVDPVNGVMAVAEGQINYFVKNGTVSCFVRKLVATDNVGSAYMQFVILRDKLSKEGLFDNDRKKRVPHCCGRIGVVTSETGAVIHDITNVCLRRQPFTEIYLFPVKVQGDGAELEIARGILYFNDFDVDAVIVGRGGGSGEDLSVFNSEIVVRAVAASNKPVVSAVGHGVDFTLCDFAADKRAVTPSEAAELVTVDVHETKIGILRALDGAGSVIRKKTEKVQNSMSLNLRYLLSAIDHRITEQTNALKFVLDKISEREQTFFDRSRLHLENSLKLLNGVNPLNILKRGYAKVSKDDSTISQVCDLNVGDKVEVTLSDGKFTAVVTQKEKK